MGLDSATMLDEPSDSSDASETWGEWAGWQVVIGDEVYHPVVLDIGTVSGAVKQGRKDQVILRSKGTVVTALMIPPCRARSI